MSIQSMLEKLVGKKGLESRTVEVYEEQARCDREAEVLLSGAQAEGLSAILSGQPLDANRAQRATELEQRAGFAEQACRQLLIKVLYECAAAIPGEKQARVKLLDATLKEPQDALRRFEATYLDLLNQARLLGCDVTPAEEPFSGLNLACRHVGSLGSQYHPELDLSKYHNAMVKEFQPAPLGDVIKRVNCARDDIWSLEQDGDLNLAKDRLIKAGASKGLLELLAEVHREIRPKRKPAPKPPERIQLGFVVRWVADGAAHEAGYSEHDARATAAHHRRKGIKSARAGRILGELYTDASGNGRTRRIGWYVLPGEPALEAGGDLTPESKAKLCEGAIPLDQALASMNWAERPSLRPRPQEFTPIEDQRIPGMPNRPWPQTGGHQ